MVRPPDPPVPESTPGSAREGEVERVYRQLHDWLRDAVLPPGRFLSEPDLARACETSRTPVREACMRLHQDGWLTRYPRKGFLVTPISARDIVDLYQFRKLLECFAAERAAPSTTPARIRDLRALLEVEGRPGAPTQEWLAANEAFHLRIAALAGNERVHRQLALTLAFSRRLDTLYLREDATWIAHDDLLAALEAHQGLAASRAMAAHLDHCQDALVKLFGQSAPFTP
jgi:DNA-binding GntR family transcriptional regulator